VCVVDGQVGAERPMTNEKSPIIQDLCNMKRVADIMWKVCPWQRKVASHKMVTSPKRKLTSHRMGTVCCGVLRCVAVCCGVLQCVLQCGDVSQKAADILQNGDSSQKMKVSQCVAACCSVWQCVAVCCSVLQCAAVCVAVG